MSPTNDFPDVDVHQEMRFAVVLYGGVSLAIYINGVAQELLAMVQATATGAPDATGRRQVRYSTSNLKGAAGVYRRLAARLSGESEALRVRFIVDVLSGTSAGGINGVFLAKALANESTMDELRNLWIHEGDMDVLMNDRQSHEAGEFDSPPPSSLINSTRMFYKLRQALAGMDPRQGETRVPLVDEVDLFVTATDLTGIVKPVQLADKIVYEQSHRTVFHFRNAVGGNTVRAASDFTAKDNEFIAFAARCTSSFPVAFEPMRLEDIERVHGSNVTPLREKVVDGWDRFLRDYARHVPNEIEGSGDARSRAWERQVQERSFGDGGYLDNKPFSYALDVLGRRPSANLAVRKLLYVEPAPEDPELTRPRLVQPDPFENLLLAASVLPRSETIRDDVERVRARNRLIERVHRATRQIDSDVDAVLGAEPVDPEWARLAKEMPTSTSSEIWGRFWLEDMIPVYGAPFGAYHRLKVAGLTSHLARILTSAAGFDEDSQEYEAIRYLVSAWRFEHYTDDRAKEVREAGPRRDEQKLPPKYVKDGQEIHSENSLLLDLDLLYRIRRIEFLQWRLDLLLQGGSAATEIATSLVGAAKCDAWLASVGEELRAVKLGLTKPHVTLLRLEGELCDGANLGNPLAADLEKLRLSTSTLLSILVPRDPHARLRRARRLLNEGGRRALFEQIGETLKKRMRDVFERSSADCYESLTRRPAIDGAQGPPLDPDLCRYLRKRYDRYDYYDVVLFPMQYGTDLGEGRRVDLVRVSPEDASSLVRERIDGKPRQLSKLAGTFLGNFGGFLHEEWRHSDILWGRFDAADRIIHELLPDEMAVATDFVHQAQAAILLDTIQANVFDVATSRRLLIECCMNAKPVEAGCREILRLVRGLRAGMSALDKEQQAELEPILQRDDLVRLYRQEYRGTREVPREHGMRLLSRATQVFGRILDRVTDSKVRAGKTVASYIGLAGRLLWIFVEVAVPGSLWKLAADWWWKLLYALSVLMIVVGTIFVRDQVSRFGVWFLCVMIVIEILRFQFGMWLTSPAKSAGGKKPPSHGWALIGGMAVGLLAMAVGRLGPAIVIAEWKRVVPLVFGPIGAVGAAAIVFGAGLYFGRRRRDGRK